MKHAERIEVASDAIALAMGVKVRNPHPLAEIAAEGRLTTAVVADTLELPHTHVPRPAAAFSSDDFGLSLDQSLQLVASSTDLQNIEHRAFCGELTLRDFKESDAPRTAGGTLAPRAEGTEAQNFGISANGETVALTNYAAFEAISRHAIINASWDHVASVTRELIAAGYRRERTQVISVLEANDTLTDGVPWFHTDRSNVVSAGLDAGGLGTATAALRSLGNLELAPAHLLVPAAQEVKAKILVESSGGGISVFSDSRLTKAFLLPSRSTPVVSVAHLRGQIAPSISSRRDPKTDSYQIKCLFDLAATPVSTNGIQWTIT